jgi:hypothetical protein
MRGKATYITVAISLVLASAAPLHCGQVFGELTQVRDRWVYATFPVPVRSGSMLTILAGRGDSVAGLAISRSCDGEHPPYRVSGELRLITDSQAIVAGTQAYVDATNTAPAPSTLKSESVEERHVPRALRMQDLRLYYYAAGQTVGYGALGIGYERAVRFLRCVELQVDGGITGIGSIDSRRADVVNTNQLIKTLNGRLTFDLGRHVGVYSAYRWNEGRGDEERWQKVAQNLSGKPFAAPSETNVGTVQTRGIEYGLSVRPFTWLGLSAGYIPALRADYGSLGVRCEPGYTGEVRLGQSHIIARFRGTYSDGYWLGDIGVTLR